MAAARDDVLLFRDPTTGVFSPRVLPRLDGLVARARGMSRIAKNAGLNRESLYKALGETGNPEFSTVMRIVRALGLTLSARPAATGRTSKRRRVA